MSRSATVPVCCKTRSAMVDLPWSMWAMMEKFLMCLGSMGTFSKGRGRQVHATSVRGKGPLRDRARRRAGRARTGKAACELKKKPPP